MTRDEFLRECERMVEEDQPEFGTGAIGVMEYDAALKLLAREVVKLRAEVRRLKAFP